MLWHRLLTIFLFLLPFSFALNPTEGVDLSLARVLAIVVFFFWFLDALKNKHLLIDQRPRFWFFLLFLFIASLSYSWAIDPARSFKKVLFLVPFFLLYFPVYAASVNKTFRLSMVKTIFWSSFLAAVIGFLQFSAQFIMGIDATQTILSKTLVPFFQGKIFAKLILQYPSFLVNIAGSTFMRAFGTFPDPHLFSLYLNLTLPLGIYLYLKKEKSLYLFLSAFIFVVSLLSFSRAAYLSLAAAGIFLIFFSAFIKTLKKNPLIFFLLSLLGVAIFFTSNPLSQRFFDSFNLREGSNSGRLAMWQAAINITADYPLTGIGLGNFSSYIAPEASERNPIYAHNLFLDFASETGLIAAFALSLSLLSPISSYIKHPTLLKKYIAASFVILIVHSLFETPFYSVHVFPLTITLLALKTTKAIA